MFDAVAFSAEYGNVCYDYRLKEREEAVVRLRELCHDVASQVGAGVKVMTAVSEYPLLRAMMEVLENEDVDLVVVGSDHYSYSSDSFIAGNVMRIAKISPVRVLIVPANFTYQPVKEALVPFDFNAIQSLDKLNSVQTSPQWADVKLQVLNVDPKEQYLHPDEKFKTIEESLHQYLKNFQHHVYHTNEKNIIDGIINFASEHDVQLIIALPGKYSFLYSLTHANISEALYRNSQKPVLILK
jgi:nucleotide-binding universal stress UspA family protein